MRQRWYSIHTADGIKYEDRLPDDLALIYRRQGDRLTEIPEPTVDDRELLDFVKREFEGNDDMIAWAEERYG